ncbi:CBS domain-containing protein, partial [Sulfitobacter aestuarii]
VGELMHGGDAIPVIPSDAPMSEVLLAMTSKGFGLGVLVEDGRISGVITDGDLRRNMDGLMARRAGEIANPDPVTVTADCLAPEALAILNARKVSVLLVADDENRPVGVLHIHDLLRAGVV